MNRTTTKKKMAFSLMRLITIFALALVAPSAMAGEFGVSLDATGDVSSAGDLQLAHPGTSLVVLQLNLIGLLYSLQAKLL